MPRPYFFDARLCASLRRVTSCGRPSFDMAVSMRCCNPPMRSARAFASASRARSSARRCLSSSVNFVSPLVRYREGQASLGWVDEFRFRPGFRGGFMDHAKPNTNGIVTKLDPGALGTFFETMPFFASSKGRYRRAKTRTSRSKTRIRCCIWASAGLSVTSTRDPCEPEVTRQLSAIQATHHSTTLDWTRCHVQAQRRAFQPD
jgi:hypothetical protein